MTDDFFDDAVRESAPGFKFKNLKDTIKGTVVDQFTIDATDINTGKVLRDRDDKVIKQRVLVLQTDLRNWDNVTRIPKVDRRDKNSESKPPSEDDGKRALYVKKYTNIYSAVGGAVYAATGVKGPALNGGTLAVQWYDEEDTGKPQPLKLYRAKYEPPAAAPDDDEFFASEPPAREEEPKAAEEKKAAPAPDDPWASSNNASDGDSPPF